MFRDMFREAGFEARRGQQFSGGTDSPDVVVTALPDFHWEIKFWSKNHSSHMQKDYCILYVAPRMYHTRF